MINNPRFNSNKLSYCFLVCSINIYRVTNIVTATPMIINMHAPTRPPTNVGRFSVGKHDIIYFEISKNIM